MQRYEMYAPANLGERKGGGQETDGDNGDYDARTMVIAPERV
jgi:hypothetical protein